jgi:hypothetical protein
VVLFLTAYTHLTEIKSSKNTEACRPAAMQQLLLGNNSAKIKDINSTTALQRGMVCSTQQR